MPPTTPQNDLLLRAARRERTERTPVWLMRQAGRFDPEYQRIRSGCGLELEEMFRTPQLAAEITMLPVRLGVDAAILFQDILTPLAPMGAPFVFRPGPMLDQPIRSRSDIDRLRPFDPREDLSFVERSIDLALGALDGRLPLLGFAGAPLTLAAFLTAGGSPGGSILPARALMRDDPAAMHRLLDLLARTTADYLQMQMDAGVHAVQLFESCADLVTDSEYEAFAQPYQRAVLQRLPAECPKILFIKERTCLDLAVQAGADVLSVGGCVDLNRAIERYGDRVAIQGNADNRILHDGPRAAIEAEVRRCIEAGGRIGHILNLNHGILRGTPFEHVRWFIEAARSFTPEDVGAEVAERS